MLQSWSPECLYATCCECWKLNLGFLQEWYVLLSLKPSLQPLTLATLYAKTYRRLHHEAHTFLNRDRRHERVSATPALLRILMTNPETRWNAGSATFDQLVIYFLHPAAHCTLEYTCLFKLSFLALSGPIFPSLFAIVCM